MKLESTDLKEKITQSEKALGDALHKSKATLGSCAPRLLTEKPQAAANCLRHGLTGETVFLTPFQMRDYLAIGQGFILEYKPITQSQIFLVQRIIDAEWRLSHAASLATICQTSALILESQAIYEANPHLLVVTEGSVLADHVLAHSNAGAIRRLCEGPNVFEKLDRHETRLWRLLLSMRAEYERLYARIPLKVRQAWKKEICPSYNWYKNLYDLSNELMDARNELADKSTLEISTIRQDGTRVTDRESIPSEEKLFCAKRLKITQPLSKQTLETIQNAHRKGMTTELEETLFPLAA
jgi:hypothetical protein